VFLGLRSLILATRDLDAAKAWYTQVLGVPPYFDEPFYVGFRVGGFELGLWPGRSDDYPAGGETYWGVVDIDDAWERLLAGGARVSSEVIDVGGGVRMGTLLDPEGNRIGIIENPHFEPGLAG
jgi:catechol 2,3-dioxygenase-like lactoylglutathione lyase family enzyme